MMKMLGWLFYLAGCLLVSKSPTPNFGSLGLVLLAGGVSLILCKQGMTFLASLLFYIYLGGMMVVFCYCTALAPERHPKVLASWSWWTGVVVYFIIVASALYACEIDTCKLVDINNFVAEPPMSKWGWTICTSNSDDDSNNNNNKACKNDLNSGEKLTKFSSNIKISSLVIISEVVNNNTTNSSDLMNFIGVEQLYSGFAGMLVLTVWMLLITLVGVLILSRGLTRKCLRLP